MSEGGYRSVLPRFPIVGFDFLHGSYEPVASSRPWIESGRPTVVRDLSYNFGSFRSTSLTVE